MATDSSTNTRRFAAAVPPPAFVQPGTGVVVQEGDGAANNNARARQLTIFYGGMVVVLDGCAPEKAAELIRLAAAAEGQEGKPQPTPAPAPAGDILIARNASLRRFLSKRKHRATATAPVLDSDPVPFQRKDEGPEPEPEPAAKKGRLEVSHEEASSTWLALGSLGSMHAL